MSFALYHENPHMLHVNTLPNRAYYVPFTREQTAVGVVREESERV